MAQPQKRLNVNLPESTFNELKALAEETHRSMTDVVRTALGLVKIAMEEEKKQHSVAIVDKDDKVLKEIVLVK